MGTRSPSTSTVDGTFRAFLTANQPRQDLVDAGLTTEPNHGFTWTPSPPLDGNLHAVAVYAINVGGGAAGVQPVGREPASREPRSPARGPRAADERPDQLPGRAGRHHHVEGRQTPLPRRRPQPEQLAGDRAGRR